MLKELNRRSIVAIGAILIPLLASGSEIESRSDESHFVRMPGPAPSAETTSASRLRLEYDTFTWFELNDAEFARLRDSGRSFQEFAEPYTLRLGEQSFDPIDGLPAIPTGWQSGLSDGSDLHLVQFVGPTRAGWLDALGAGGLDVVQYIPPFTYVVWGKTTDRVGAADIDAVRWTGPFAPAFRVLPRWRNLPAAAQRTKVLLYRGADTDAAVRAIEGLGGTITGRTVLNHVFESVGVTISGTAIREAAHVPGVYSIQPVHTDGGLRGEMSDQVSVNNVDGSNTAFPGYMAWLDGVQLSGVGVIIANVDGGIADTHADLVNRMVGCTGQTCGGSDSSSHGTHTAGIMAADGSSGVTDAFGFLRGLGQAPGASLVEQVYSPWFTQAGGMLLLMTDSFNNGASLSGNSWGPSGSPQGYDDDTMQVDIGVRDADPNVAGNQPLTFVLSFMNGSGGTSSQGTPDEAKNLFNIGSTKMQTSSGAQILQIDDVSSNSAHGPALDGRTIPHMVAPGCSVDSSVPGGYGTMCGTSMASPHVSGAVALFIEYYRGLPGYDADPSPALIKAAFLPVSHDLAGHSDADGGTLGHPFDSKQGWGRMDLEAVVDPQLTARYFDNPAVFDNTGEEWVTNLSPLDPSQAMRIKLVWTDAPGHGLGGSTPAWNNDLDLVVEAGGNTYRGNGFGPDGWSQAGAAADGINNTEGVFLGPASPGVAAVRVIAANINSDGVPNEGDTTDQDFALVCYNCAEEPGFILTAAPAAMDICVPDDAVYSVGVGQIMDFTEPVTLSATGAPAGTSVTFSVNPVTPPGSTTMTIGNTGSAAPGSYSVDLLGTSATLTRNAFVGLTVYTTAPGAPSLIAPSNGATNVALVPTFEWSGGAQSSDHAFEVASDAGFANLIAGAAGLSGTTYTLATPLLPLSTYYWRTRSSNTCGDGAYSAVFSFTTRDIPAVLLVDDDDNTPNVLTFYDDAFNALGLEYDLWDTNNTDNEPDAATLLQYETVVWFTGEEWGGAAGPGSAGEGALGQYLDGGGCLFISSQDYHYDRGTTSFMTNYLGVASIDNDVNQTQVTGAGSVFGGMGPYALSYPFSNYGDRMVPDATSEVAFAGNDGNAAINKGNGVYRTTYWGFPFEAAGTAADRANLLNAVLDWCASVDFIDCNGNGVPDTEESLGDFDLDCDVDLDDFATFEGCFTGPGGPAGLACGFTDLDRDNDVDMEDLCLFQLAFSTP